MKRHFIAAAQWLLGGLMILTLLAGAGAPAAQAMPVAQVQTGTPGFYPRVISTLDYKAIGDYAAGPVVWLQVGDDWLAYARRVSPPCGQCSIGLVAIELSNVLTGQHAQIKAATWFDTYPNGFATTGIPEDSLHLSGSDLIWEQPGPTPPAPKDPRETIQYNPGQVACTLCYYDLRSGQGKALAGLEAAAAPDPSRLDLFDVKAGHVLALLRDSSGGGSFLISDIASGHTDSVPVPATDVKQAFLLADGLTVVWIDTTARLFAYQPGMSAARQIAAGADLPGVSGHYVVWVNGRSTYYNQPSDEANGTLPEQVGYNSETPHALDAITPAVAWAGLVAGGWTPLDVMTFGDSGNQSLLHQGVPGQVDQIWLNGDKLVFVTDQKMPDGSDLYQLQLAWLVAPDSAFADRWARADAPVASGAVQRSWLWGPAPFYLGKEQYGDGARLVQYYDKSRMEVNQPSSLPGDKAQPYYVTNGLLVVEMIEGRIRTGDTAAIPAAVPATIPVAGDKRADNPLTPDYATLRGVASLAGDHQAPNRLGQSVNEAIDVRGVVAPAPPNTAPAHYAAYAAETNHNIPDVFWSYLQGMPATYGFDWVYVFGYPITEAYWTQMRVGGKDYPVLIQAYQRRVLTYAPDFPAGWQVQQGNVGQHYFEWRYVLNR